MSPDQPESLATQLNDRSPEELCEIAGRAQLNEDLALALLTRRDLPSSAIEALANNRAVAQRRRVQLEIVRHPRAPRHISLPILRRLYTFELMQVALSPSVATDLKMAAEDTLISRLETVSSGEKLTLARRGSTRIAASLLLDPDTRIAETALTNPYLTEACIVKALMKDDSLPGLAERVADHPTWSLRIEVQTALLECGKLPFARLQQLVRTLASRTLQTALSQSRLPALARAAALDELNRRSHEQAATGLR
jgi:hypothetical protein